MVELDPYREYNLHDHISVCYMYLDEAFKSPDHIKHEDPIKLVLAERWAHYISGASCPQEVIETFKSILPSKKRAFIPSEDLLTEYV